jgi:hypothetical protein
MNNLNDYLERFFRVMVSGRAYLNAVYLLLALPLGTFYFVYLVTGLLVSIPLMFILVGFFLLIFVLVSWWVLAAFERQLTMLLLGVKIGPMSLPVSGKQDVWTRIKNFLINSVTWKGLAYLLLKFPIGLISFIVATVLIALTGAFITAPLTYKFYPIQIYFWDGVSWLVNTPTNAVIVSIIGIVLWPVSLHIMNGLAYVSGWFAKLMLGHEIKIPAAPTETQDAIVPVEDEPAVVETVLDDEGVETDEFIEVEDTLEETIKEPIIEEVDTPVLDVTESEEDQGIEIDPGTQGPDASNQKITLPGHFVDDIRDDGSRTVTRKVVNILTFNDGSETGEYVRRGTQFKVSRKEGEDRWLTIEKLDG